MDKINWTPHKETSEKERLMVSNELLLFFSGRTELF